MIYYSTYGHVATLARAMKEGIDAVDGVEGVLYQVGDLRNRLQVEEM